MNLNIVLSEQIRTCVCSFMQSQFALTMAADSVILQPTSQEHVGDYTLVLFPLAKASGQNPVKLGEELAQDLQSKLPDINHTEVVKGFLNLQFRHEWWQQELMRMQLPHYHQLPATGKKVVLEYCGPNTNKPLHIGHIRNMMIGFSLSRILQAAGDEVIKVNIYNDRGIAISKSMVSWKRFAQGATPASTGIKGDHFVGDFYVRYNQAVQEEIRQMENPPAEKEQAEKLTSIHREAQQMVVDWESGKEEVRALWKQMNDWVYSGFQETYQLLGVDFQKDYYESETYLLGKKFVEEGLNSHTFLKRPDGAVIVDLTAEGLDQKVLLRADGTSVYITQDLATAQLRYDDFGMDKMIYVVADEQNYHFKVLKYCLLKMGKSWAQGIYHLAYALVESPTGRFKSREGKTADADDLIQEVMRIAAEKTRELGKVDHFSPDALQDLFRQIGLGALKFFILRVNPFKKIIFNPEESIDFHGQTGPFIQYTHARIRSILRKNAGTGEWNTAAVSLTQTEKQLLRSLSEYKNTISSSALKYDPSEIAQYAYALAKLFNKYYAETSILGAEDENTLHMRLSLCREVASRIKDSMYLLGIDVPEQM